jgi:phytoene desaturase (3,4-didehydrolycopene-forming)
VFTKYRRELRKKICSVVVQLDHNKRKTTSVCLLTGVLYIEYNLEMINLISINSRFQFVLFFSCLHYCHTLSIPSKSQQHVVVVGGGVGGLSTAARIASSLPHASVLVIEKNDHIGGRCGSFTVSTHRGDFRHERGPSLLLLKDYYVSLFQECSANSKGVLEYGLEIVDCIPAYQVIFDDGDRIELGFPIDTKQSIRETNSRQKMNSYESNGSKKWDTYLKTMAAFLDCGLPNFIEEKLDLKSFPAFLKESLRDGAQAWPLKPHSDVLDSIFESTKMKALASFQNLYVGLDPYRSNDQQLFGGILRKTAPAVFGLLAAIELHPTKGGVYAPVGGFEAVTNALERLVHDQGVEIQCGSTVTSVTDKGVYVQNEGSNESSFIPADMVIINADLPYATKVLLLDETEEVRYDWDDKYDFSSGVIAFHWSIEAQLTDLNTHNVFLVADSRPRAEASWRVLHDHDDKHSLNDSLEPFNFYVHRASCVDATAAPEGCDSILVLVPSATLTRLPECEFLSRSDAFARYKEQFNDKVIAQTRTRVLQRMAAIPSLQGLESRIIHEVIDTPVSYAEKYHVAAGTPFALSHGLAQLSFMRPGAMSSKYSNVLFVGASSRPGNGVPLVLIGAKLVAEKAISILKAGSAYE